MQYLETYINPVTNTTLDVYMTGASFKTVTKYPAIERPNNRGTMPAEEVEKKHRTFAGVDARVKKLNMIRVEV
jgi:hypothetical protein